MVSYRDWASHSWHYWSGSIFGYSENHQQLQKALRQSSVETSAVQAAFNKENFSYLFYDLSESLNKLQATQLNSLLSDLFNKFDDRALLTEELLTILPLKKIEEAAKTTAAKHGATIARFVEPRYLNDSANLQNSLKMSVLNFIIDLFDELVYSFFDSKLMKARNAPTESIISGENDPRSINQLRFVDPFSHFNQIDIKRIILDVRTILFIIPLWTNMLFPNIISTKKLAIVSSLILYCATLTLFKIYRSYFQKIRPDFNGYAMPWKPMVTLARTGAYDDICGRDFEIQELIQALIVNADSTTRVHPCLVAPSGVGKTAIVQGLAREIARGMVPSQLQGMEIFEIDATTLNADAIGVLARSFQNNPRVILFLDELQGNGSSDNSLHQHLKKFLDNQRFCICATTTDEFEKYIESQTGGALSRRLGRMNVQSLSNESTLQMMTHLIAKTPDLLVEPGAVEKIATIHETLRNAPQPFTSTKLLNRALVQAQQGTEPEQIQIQLKTLYSKRAKLESEQTLRLHAGRAVELNDEAFAEIQNEIAPLEEQLAQLAAKKNKIRDLLSRQRQVIAEIEKLSIKIKNGKATAKEQQRFLLLDAYVRPALRKAFDEANKECPQFVVTETMVNALIDQEKTALSGHNPITVIVSS